MKKLFALALAGLLLALPLSVHAEGEDDPLWNRPSFEKKVFDIGQRLLQANGIDTRIAFRIVQDKDVNAAALRASGTKHMIFVNRGLLDYISNDDELAAVLGHEIAHIIRRHGHKSRMKQTGMAALMLTLMAPTLDPNAVAPAIQAGSAMGQAFSKKYESEADRLGIDYMVKGGYNPLAMETIMTKISGDAGPVTRFFASHPMGKHRLDDIREHIQGNYPEFLTPEVAANPPGMPYQFQPGGQPVSTVSDEDTETAMVASEESESPATKESAELHRKLFLLAEHGEIPDEAVGQTILDSADLTIEGGLSLMPPQAEALEASIGPETIESPKRISYQSSAGAAGNKPRKAFSRPAGSNPDPVKAQAGGGSMTVAEVLLSLNADELRFIRLLKEQEFMDARQFRDYFDDLNLEAAEAMLWNMEQKRLIRVLGSVEEGVYVLTDRAAQALGQN